MQLISRRQIVERGGWKEENRAVAPNTVAYRGFMPAFAARSAIVRAGAFLGTRLAKLVS
jgi:hypothetical protein